MIKKITTIQYSDTFHLAIQGTKFFVPHCGEFEHLSLENHESVDPLI
jgi:hypothetical protein